MRRKEELITISEAAERVSTTRERLYNAIERGDLKTALNKPRHVLLEPSEVDRWAAMPISKGGRPRNRPTLEQESEG